MRLFRSNGGGRSVRRSQVERIEKARQDWIAANIWGTKEDRARADAVVKALLRTSSDEEVQQASREHPL